MVHGNFPGGLCRIVATTHVAKITRLYVLNFARPGPARGARLVAMFATPGSA
ncbi:hypothetical protein BN2497_9987 [Janthinobacterium sp. CG23_2]|nr:hypothetical protein BN2497_9987 [Janthinobacterium sp. CG23_2]CUU31391.1 hypothetical protein BN3177_9987 [Janthinobacterium sp. CG23_2]